MSERGGIALEDGSVITVETIAHNDEGDQGTVEERYTTLCSQDNVNFLLSPTMGTLVAPAAAIADEHNTIMLTTANETGEMYQQGYSTTYQVLTPPSSQLIPAVDLLKEIAPDAGTIAIVYENTPAYTIAAETLRSYAEQEGYEVPLFESYEPGTTDFNALIAQVQQTAPDALMGGGDAAGGTLMAQQISDNAVPLNMLALLNLPMNPDFETLGTAGAGVMGLIQWDATADYNSNTAQSEGLQWIGPTTLEFVSAYQDAYGEPPTYHAASGYAAGLVLEQAIQDSGSLDTQVLIETLDTMGIMTFYGAVSFDEVGETHGMQRGHSMVAIQWQPDDSGQIFKQAVWPLNVATSAALYPMR